MGNFFTEKVDIAGGAEWTDEVGGTEKTELTEGTELTEVDGTDVTEVTDVEGGGGC